MGPPWKSFSKTIHEYFRDRVKFPENISRENKVCIACSGGIDSVGLVLIAAQVFHRQQIAILHYNHNTRGKETDDDEIFVRGLARELEVDFFSDKKKFGTVTESFLRAKRYDFFGKIMDQIGSRYLMTAHHADDVVETMLMRLARGSAEIAAPKFCQKFSLDKYRARPLIHIPKKDLINFFTDNNIPWREDTSNQEEHYLRNRIRKAIAHYDDVFCRKNWESGFLLSHKYLEEDSLCLTALAEQYCNDPDILNLQPVTHAAIIRRAIRFWLGKDCVNRTCFEQIFEATANNTTQKIAINDHTIVEISNKILKKRTQIRPHGPFTFGNWILGSIYLPNHCKLTREILPFNTSDLDECKNTLNKTIVFVDPEKCREIYIRTWENGDCYQPINAPQKSLKKLFSEKKIPPPVRHQLPVLCDRHGKIFWVPNLPPADFVKVQNNFAMKITFSST